MQVWSAITSGLTGPTRISYQGQQNSWRHDAVFKTEPWTNFQDWKRVHIRVLLNTARFRNVATPWMGC